MSGIKERERQLESEIGDEVQVGAVMVKCMELREMLQNGCRRIWFELREMMVDGMRRMSGRIVHEMEESRGRMMRKVESIRELVSLREYLKREVMEEMERRGEEIERCMGMYE